MKLVKELLKIGIKVGLMEVILTAVWSSGMILA